MKSIGLHPEQIRFIESIVRAVSDRRFVRLNISAVPGSGKTTALLHAMMEVNKTLGIDSAQMLMLCANINPRKDFARKMKELGMSNTNTKTFDTVRCCLTHQKDVLHPGTPWRPSYSTVEDILNGDESFVVSKRLPRSYVNLRLIFVDEAQSIPAESIIFVERWAKQLSIPVAFVGDPRQQVMASINNVVGDFDTCSHSAHSTEQIKFDFVESYRLLPEAARRISSVMTMCGKSELSERSGTEISTVRTGVAEKAFLYSVQTVEQAKEVVTHICATASTHRASCLLLTFRNKLLWKLRSAAERMFVTASGQVRMDACTVFTSVGKEADVVILVVSSKNRHDNEHLRSRVNMFTLMSRHRFELHIVDYGAVSERDDGVDPPPKTILDLFVPNYRYAPSKDPVPIPQDVDETVSSDAMSMYDVATGKRKSSTELPITITKADRNVHLMSLLTAGMRPEMFTIAAAKATSDLFPGDYDSEYDSTQCGYAFEYWLAHFIGVDLRTFEAMRGKVNLFDSLYSQFLMYKRSTSAIATICAATIIDSDADLFLGVPKDIDSKLADVVARSISRRDKEKVHTSVCKMFRSAQVAKALIRERFGLEKKWFVGKSYVSSDDLFETNPDLESDDIVLEIKYGDSMLKWTGTKAEPNTSLVSQVKMHRVLCDKDVLVVHCVREPNPETGVDRRVIRLVHFAKEEIPNALPTKADLGIKND